MGVRFDYYQDQIKRAGEDGDSTVEDLFLKIFRDIDARIGSVEDRAASAAELEDQLKAYGTSQIDGLIIPIRDAIKSAGDLGAILTASSVSAVNMAVGTVDFVVVEADRTKFAPPAMLVVASTDNPEKLMWGRRVTYDKVTGVLSVEVLSVTGSGLYSSWTISAGAMVGLAAQVPATPPEGYEGSTVQLLINEIVTAIAGVSSSSSGLAVALTDHQLDTDNPHNVTPGQIGTLTTGEIGGLIGTAVSGMGAVKQDAAAILSMLSALAATANKLPWFPDSVSMALADFAAKGRDIAAADTMTSLLAKLGPVFGGPAPIPSSSGLALSDGDFNTIIAPGIFTTLGTWNNGPLGNATHSGILQVVARASTTYYVQTWYRTSGEVYMRFSALGSATWPNAWFRIDKPIYGANSNGSYLLFADGSMLFAYNYATGQDITAANGSIYLTTGTNTWTYPVTPTAIPRVSVTPASAGRWGAVQPGLGSAAFRSIGASSSATLIAVDLIAFGRWL